MTTTTRDPDRTRPDSPETEPSTALGLHTACVQEWARWAEEYGDRLEKLLHP